MAISKKKKFAVAGGVGALVITASAAFAYWTSTGSDDTTASVANEGEWTVLIDDATVGDGTTLTPDGDIDTISFAVDNDEEGTKQITGTTVEITDVDATGTCSAADFAITDITSNAGVDVAAGGSVPGSFKVQMIDTGVNQDGCKGATLTYTVTVS
ncbi:hypothetical protein [Nocardioides sp. WS12]|uniref:hypothetical protein n=1 Tax=Nocardioides sp. WS12 TaxID=2486272 RepID=UPI0015F9E0EF|nr:hypothetical protein [Nocardioides sp. WS12]